MENTNMPDPGKRIKGSGAGIATPASSPVTGVKIPTGTNGYPPGLDDPTKKYPVPPFKEQSQPWPGLAGRMDPKPDHSEQSYKGSGRLTGRKALITGGDSGMGRAAAIAYAREGADVAINYLPAEEEDAKEVIGLIKAEGRKGIAIPGDLREEAFCKQLVADAVAALGGLDIVVNNAARQQTHDSILDISTEQFDWTMKTNIYAPFWIIKAALPHLLPGSAISKQEADKNISHPELISAAIEQESEGMLDEAAALYLKCVRVKPANEFA